MQNIENQDKKEKAILEIKELSKKLHQITNFLYDCDRESPEEQQEQLDEAVLYMSDLVEKYAERNFLNSVCLKVFAGAVQFTLKCFLNSLKAPTLIRPDDMN